MFTWEEFTNTLHELEHEGDPFLADVKRVFDTVEAAIHERKQSETPAEPEPPAQFGGAPS